MAVQSVRYSATSPATAAEGWSLERFTPASRLYSANGIRTGADGRIYIAQCSGSAIAAIDVDSGEIETISPRGGPIVGPDDLVFDDDGNLYVTELTENQVRMLAPNGTSKVIMGDIPVANPITYHQGRLIAGELRMGARIMELDRDGGEPEVVARDLGVPDSVKFHPDGYIVSTQVHSGQVLKIDPRTGAKSVLADLAPGLDNVTFVNGRTFVSHGAGSIHEIVAPGKTRTLVDTGLEWPLGLAVGPDGTVFVADGPYAYTVAAGGNLELAGMLFTPGFPGWARDVAADGAGQWLVSTANGTVARWRPGEQAHEELASGYDRLMGVAIAPGGAIVFAEWPTGRVLSLEGGRVSELAGGLDKPMGVAVGGDGAVYVAESGGGRVVKVSGGKAQTVIDGLSQPEGIAVSGSKLYVVDTLTKDVVESDLATGSQRVIASGLPVGAPEGAIVKQLGGVGDFCGPMYTFTGIAVGGDRTIYVAGDAEGSVLAIREM